MGGPRKDRPNHTGKKVGDWIVGQYLGKFKYKLMCENGHEKTACAQTIIYGKIHPCLVCKKTNNAKKLSGKKIGDWEIVGLSSKFYKWKPEYSTYLDCKCKNGHNRVTEIRKIDLLNRIECIQCRQNSYAGLKFGNWTSLGKSELSTKKKNILKCVCKCGKISHIAKGLLVSGKTKQCIHCSARSRVKPNGEAVFNSVYSQYIRQAKKRGIDWSLTKEQFSSLIKMNCFYTNLPPSNITTKNGSTLIYNGIDRLDDTKGYTIENSVPCIGDINMMKRSMEYSHFINLCNLVSINTSKINKSQLTLKAV